MSSPAHQTTALAHDNMRFMWHALQLQPGGQGRCSPRFSTGTTKLQTWLSTLYMCFMC